MKVYFDASIQSNHIGVGIYCETLNERHSLNFPIKTKEIHIGEFIAYREAKRLYPNATVYYTDNQGLAQTLKTVEKIKWISREYNKIADKLSKQQPNQPITNIAQYIREYPIQKRLNLWNKFVSNPFDKFFLTLLMTNKEIPEELPPKLSKNFCLLVMSTYSKKDKLNSSIKEALKYHNYGNYTSLTDEGINKLLNSLY